MEKMKFFVVVFTKKKFENSNKKKGRGDFLLYTFKKKKLRS
jgi:hypothetical protein